MIFAVSVPTVAVLLVILAIGLTLAVSAFKAPKRPVCNRCQREIGPREMSYPTGDGDVFCGRCWRVTGRDGLGEM